MNRNQPKLNLDQFKNRLIRIDSGPIRDSNPNESRYFQPRIYSNWRFSSDQSELVFIRIKFSDWKYLDSFGLKSRIEPESIRIKFGLDQPKHGLIPVQSETLTQMNPNNSNLGSVWIENWVQINPKLSLFGLNSWIEPESIRMNPSSIWINPSTDWFKLIPVQPETSIRMNPNNTPRIHSD